MSPISVQVPRRSTLEVAVAFAEEISKLPLSEEFVFQFENTGRIEPFALLFLSCELSRFRSNRPDAKCIASGFENCSYAAHMGFFQAFGLDHGKKPGKAKGSGSYLPITIFDADVIRKGAADNFEPVGEFIDNEAKRMAAILSRSDAGDIFDTLAYSIREIVRNVIEHSNADQFGFCAQYWPTYNSVELAILDRGVGIRDSLSRNSKLIIKDDRDALNLSLMPGVSGNPSSTSKRRTYDFWANAGFGLYMTSRLCREGGSFFIASGTTGLYLSEEKRKYLNTPFNGTAIRLSLNTNRIRSLSDRLARYREEANLPFDSYTASVASAMLKEDFQNYQS